MAKQPLQLECQPGLMKTNAPLYDLWFWPQFPVHKLEFYLKMIWPKYHSYVNLMGSYVTSAKNVFFDKKTGYPCSKTMDKLNRVIWERGV